MEKYSLSQFPLLPMVWWLPHPPFQLEETTGASSVPGHVRAVASTASVYLQLWRVRPPGFPGSWKCLSSDTEQEVGTKGHLALCPSGLHSLAKQPHCRLCRLLRRLSVKEGGPVQHCGLFLSLFMDVTRISPSHLFIYFDCFSSKSSAFDSQTVESALCWVIILYCFLVFQFSDYALIVNFFFVFP